MVYYLSGEVGCKKNCNKFNSVTRRVYKTAHFRNWHDSALLQLKSKGLPAVPIGRFRIEITLYHGTLRRVDSDNQVTSILDLLQDSCIIKDDCWTCVSEKVIRDVYRKGEPGALIEIEPLTDSPQ
jgi:Holliday junction resolvase RusA-like endonuclease